jgi:hypothetical protein
MWVEVMYSSIEMNQVMAGVASFSVRFIKSSNTCSMFRSSSTICRYLSTYLKI